jgi:hypothetical protein
MDYMANRVNSSGGALEVAGCLSEWARRVALTTR